MKEKHRPIIVGVSGGSASGKTTMCDKIIKILGEVKVNINILSIDRYYFPLTKEQRDDNLRLCNYNFDHPDSIDFDYLQDTITRYINRQDNIEIPVYSFATNLRADKCDILRSGDMLLVEGIFALYKPKIAELFDIKIYVHTDSDIRLSRRILRDAATRGMDVDMILRMYKKFVRPCHENFVKIQMEQADVIVPHGKENNVGLNLIINSLKMQLDESLSGQLSGKILTRRDYVQETQNYVNEQEIESNKFVRKDSMDTFLKGNY